MLMPMTVKQLKTNAWQQSGNDAGGGDIKAAVVHPHNRIRKYPNKSCWKVQDLKFQHWLKYMLSLSVSSSQFDFAITLHQKR